MKRSIDENQRETRIYGTDESAHQAFEQLQENGASPTITQDHGNGESVVTFDREHYEDEKSRS